MMKNDSSKMNAVFGPVSEKVRFVAIVRYNKGEIHLARLEIGVSTAVCGTEFQHYLIPISSNKRWAL